MEKLCIGCLIGPKPVKRLMAMPGLLAFDHGMTPSAVLELLEDAEIGAANLDSRRTRARNAMKKAGGTHLWTAHCKLTIRDCRQVHGMSYGVDLFFLALLWPTTLHCGVQHSSANTGIQHQDPGTKACYESSCFCAVRPTKLRHCCLQTALSLV